MPFEQTITFLVSLKTKAVFALEMFNHQINRSSRGLKKNNKKKKKEKVGKDNCP